MMNTLFATLIPGFQELIVLFLIALAGMFLVVRNKRVSRILGAALLSFLVATLFTPPDLVSTLCLSGLIFAIFFLGIWVGKGSARSA